VKRKHKQALRRLSEDNARLKDYLGMLSERLADMRKDVEGMQWRLDEVTPKFPPVDEQGIRAAILDGVK